MDRNDRGHDVARPLQDVSGDPGPGVGEGVIGRYQADTHGGIVGIRLDFG